MSSDRPGYVSAAAVAWVLDHAPDVPPQLVATLVGIARHADDAGRNSYPSIETLTKYTRKSERQVRSDIKELRSRSLIVAAEDQSPAAWIRADRRPTVYHLAMTGCGTPQVVGSTPKGSRGAVQRSTGCSTASNGVQSTAPKESSNKTEESSSSAQSPTLRYVCESTGADEDEAQQIITAVKAASAEPIRNLSGYLRALHDSGDLANHLTEIRRAARSAQIDTKLKELRHRPPCPHGEPGGDAPHPAHGGAVCVLCRRGAPPPAPEGPDPVEAYRKTYLATFGRAPTVPLMREVGKQRMFLRDRHGQPDDTIATLAELAAASGATLIDHLRAMREATLEPAHA